MISFREKRFEGETQVTQKELENETKPERDACYTHRSKELPRVFFFLFLFADLQKGGEKKVGKRGRQRESGRDASFIE